MSMLKFHTTTQLSAFLYVPLALNLKYFFLTISILLYNITEIRLHIEELVKAVGTSRRIDKTTPEPFFTFRNKANKNIVFPQPQKIHFFPC